MDWYCVFVLFVFWRGIILNGKVVAETDDGIPRVPDRSNWSFLAATVRCNEVLMKEALIKNGPIAVSFQVYPDFTNYKSGVYHHTFLEDKFNPFELTNHVVLVVGYGSDRTDPSNPVPFWTVKNSWGPSWGEQGYFKIRRANDECAIESMAVESFPIL